MLLFSRKCGEEIVIPGLGITLTVLEVRGDRIRLGITAPVEVTLHRQEVWQCTQPLGASRMTSPCTAQRRSALYANRAVQ
jgi:carbon storage regulator